MHPFSYFQGLPVWEVCVIGCASAVVSLLVAWALLAILGFTFIRTFRQAVVVSSCIGAATAAIVSGIAVHNADARNRFMQAWLNAKPSEATVRFTKPVAYRHDSDAAVVFALTPSADDVTVAGRRIAIEHETREMPVAVNEIAALNAYLRAHYPAFVARNQALEKEVAADGARFAAGR